MQISSADASRQALQCDDMTHADHKSDGQVHCPISGDTTPSLVVTDTICKILLRFGMLLQCWVTQ